MKLKVVVPVVSIIVLVAAAACGWAYMNAQNQKVDAERESNMSVLDGGGRALKAPVVYAARDISEGAVIQPDDLEEKEVETSKIPASAVTWTSMAAGCRAKFGIAQGTMLLDGHLQRPVPIQAQSDPKSSTAGGERPASQSHHKQKKPK